jgi:hypothetical protein
MISPSCCCLCDQRTLSINSFSSEGNAEKTFNNVRCSCTLKLNNLKSKLLYVSVTLILQNDIYHLLIIDLFPLIALLLVGVRLFPF